MDFLSRKSFWIFKQHKCGWSRARGCAVAFQGKIKEKQHWGTRIHFTAGEMMALGKSSQHALNGRFVFWRSRDERAGLRIVLGTRTRASGTAVGMNTSSIAAENEPVKANMRAINQYEKGGIDLQIVLYLRPGVFVSGSDMIILKNHMIP